MKPKEKAKELVDKFYLLGTEKPLLDVYVDMEYVVAKQCALICVDEMLKYTKQFSHYTWLQEVKQEIEKL